METLETEKRLYERINECIKKNVKRKRKIIIANMMGDNVIEIV